MPWNWLVDTGRNPSALMNGSSVPMPGAPDIIDEVPAGRLYKDGALLIAAETRTVAERKRMAFSGMVMVSIAVDEKGQLVADPELELQGIPELTADGAPMFKVATDAVMQTLETLPRARRRDPDSVAEAIRRGVRAAIASHWRKKPNVTVHVLVV